MSNQTSAGFDSPRAWMVVVAAFIGAFVTFGITYSFGVFLKPMAMEFHVNHAAMSALFATITALSFFAAPLTGELADRFGARPVVACGAVLIASGLVLTSHIYRFPFMFVSYGVGLGGALACTYIPSIATVGEWFKKRRDIALGIAISGIGCGTLVVAPLSAMLIERYGWRTAFEIFGWSGGALLLLCAGLLISPPAVEKKKVDIAPKLCTRAFLLQFTCLLFAGIAVYVSFVFLPVYATEIGVSRVAGAALVGYIGASSVLGRLGLNALAPRFGLIGMYQFAYLILLLSFASWLTAHSYASLVIFALVMGVGYGGIAAMAPAVAASVFGIEGLGELLGILFIGFGVACLIGPPAAGILVDHLHDYRWPVFLAAGGAVLGLLFAIPLRRYGARRRSALSAAAD
ncbi:MAG: MFS transporter [Candidatus Korobacteraceae bacterium]